MSEPAPQPGVANSTEVELTTFEPDDEVKKAQKINTIQAGDGFPDMKQLAQLLK